MEKVIENIGVHAEIISPADGHYFFGYYDLQPFDSTGRYHLCHKAPFEDRIPEENDICELGMIDLGTKEFIKLAETTAWNFQQGAMLQWYKDDEHIIYNIREAEAYRACVLNIRTGEKRILPMAYASLSEDGTTAIGVNFSRIFDFRPGYGYAGIPDKNADVFAPEDDGVWVMDTQTGECRLVASVQQIREMFPKKPYTDEKLLVNHITLNPSGERYVMLFRNQPGDGSKWVTALIVGDMQGNMRQLAEWTAHSHYHWKNDNELLIVSRYKEGEHNPLGLYLFDVRTGEATLIPEPCPERPIKDIHCLYTPDRKYIMGDGYPDADGYRWLHFIEAATSKDVVLGKYYSYNFSEEAMEYRCDLHARFDRTGRYVTFDSNHIGNRCICVLDLNNLRRKYQIDTIENKAFLKEMRDELLNFGHRFPSPDGGSYYLGDDGTPWAERPRETWITCRMAHVYSLGSFLGHKGSEELVDAALKGLRGELRDVQNGGWYAGVTADGKALPNKQCYAHAFVILASTSALLAGREGAKELLDEALKLYDERFWNDEEGLSCDTWNTEFTMLDDYRGINANMHTVEAFLAVADALQNDTYRVRAGRIIDHVVAWAKENDWRIPEHFTKDWVPDLECNKEKPDDPFKPYGATPGHGLEWGRLITQWAVSTYKNSEAGTRYIDAAEQLYNRAVADAWNCDGARGIVYTTDWEGNPVVHDRMHWTLAEAINTSAVLYRVTGKQKYADDYAMFMEYLDEVVLDHVNGSWFHQLDQNNELMGTVWPGKSDIYHALQAALIPYSKVETSIALAVKLGQE